MVCIEERRRRDSSRQVPCHGKGPAAHPRVLGCRRNPVQRGNQDGQGCVCALGAKIGGVQFHNKVKVGRGRNTYLPGSWVAYTQLPVPCALWALSPRCWVGYLPAQSHTCPFTFLCAPPTPQMPGYYYSSLPSK